MLYLFDEPTIGLHPDDVAWLLRAFQKLVAEGHSLIVIEHNLDVIKTADYVIDLGPEGRRAGRRDRGPGDARGSGPLEALGHRPLSASGPRLV